eukprot:3647131-Karenia_brevis.AAC.1
MRSWTSPAQAPVQPEMALHAASVHEISGSGFSTNKLLGTNAGLLVDQIPLHTQCKPSKCPAHETL